MRHRTFAPLYDHTHLSNDQQGFLVPLDKAAEERSGFSGNSFRGTPSRMLHTHVDVDYGCDWIDMPPVLSRTSLDWPRRESTCWLCGGWVERKILWPVRGADVPQNAVMKTHLEIDNWEGEAVRVLTRRHVCVWHRSNGLCVRTREIARGSVEYSRIS